VHGIEDVAQTAEKVQSFCEEHGIGRKTATHCGLCMEEIARNIAEHGFHADHRKHHIEVGVALRAEDVVLRIKDDCIAFDPQEWHEMTRPDDPASNVGIRLVYGIAREVEYQNLLGLNVLTIHLAT